MSIKELLSKAKENIHTIEEQNTPTKQQEDVETNESEKKDIKKLSFLDLLEYYSEVCSWLETHECQSGTDNKLDINDRPYDSKMYCEKLEEMQDIYCEIFQRPLTDGLVERMSKYGL